MIGSLLKKLRTKSRIFYLSKTNPKTITNHGITIAIGDHISREIRYYIYSNSYEAHEISVLTRALDKSDKVLEAGTGLGFLAIFCTKVIGSDNIITYEANEGLIEKIKENFALNGQSPRLTNAILSDRETTTDFFIEEQFWSSSSRKRSAGARQVNVQCHDINEVIRQNGINFLIMDIEGGEAELIYKTDLRPINKLLIEVHPQVIGDQQSTKIIEHLSANGFSIDFELSLSNVFFFKKAA